MSKKQRKQWKLNTPVEMCSGRVSYPLGDSRRASDNFREKYPPGETSHNHKQREGEKECLVWTMRPDGNNFAVKVSSDGRVSRSTTPNSLKKSSQKFDRSAEKLSSNRISSSKKRSAWDVVIKPANSHNDEEIGPHTSFLRSIKLMRRQNLSETDMLSLSEEVWIPCRYDMDDNSLLWQSKMPRNHTYVKCFFNVMNGNIILHRTIKDLHLTTISKNRGMYEEKSSCSEVQLEMWKICFALQSDLKRVSWDPDTAMNDGDVVPFFVSDEENQVAWYVPDIGVKKRRIRILNGAGEIISCGFSCKSRTISDVTSESNFKSMENARPLSHYNSPATATAKLHELPLPSPSSVPTLPLPMASLNSSSLVGAHNQSDCPSLKEGNVYSNLTHLHSHDDLESLYWAVVTSVSMSLDDVLTLETIVDTCETNYQRRKAEWAEILTRDHFMLLREISHVMMYAICDNDYPTSDDSVMASKCMYTLAHMCPLQYQMFLNERSSVIPEICACCGCLNDENGHLEDFPPVELQVKSCCDHSFKNDMIHNLLIHLESLLNDCGVLISDFVKLYFSSNASSSSEVSDDIAVVDRYTRVKKNAESISYQASLLLLTLVSFKNLQTEISTSGQKVGHCARCRRYCLRHTVRHVSEGNEQWGDGAFFYQRFLEVLKWALEFSVKTEDLPEPKSSKSSLNDIVQRVHSTLIEASHTISLMCAPLYILVGMHTTDASVTTKKSCLLSLNFQDNMNEFAAILLQNNKAQRLYNRGNDVTASISSFDAVLVSSLYKIILETCEAFNVADESNFEEGACIEESIEKHVEFSGSTISSLYISVSVLSDILCSDESTSILPWSNETKLDIAERCLSFISSVQSRRFLISFTFPSPFILLLTSIRIFEFIDYLLWDGQETIIEYSPTPGGFISDDAKSREAILQLLEHLLEFSDDFLSDVKLMCQRAQAVKNGDDSSTAVKPVTKFASIPASNSHETEFIDIHEDNITGGFPQISDLSSVYSSKLVHILSKLYT